MSRFFILLLFTLGLLALGTDSFAQKNQRKPIQFSGIVLQKETALPLPFTNMQVKRTYRGSIADYYGFFSFATYTGDTVLFSSIGYKRKQIVVPDTISNNNYTIVILLDKDTIMLPTVEVFPLPTWTVFKEVFVKADIPDDDYERAKKNLALMNLSKYMQEVYPDAQANWGNLVSRQHYNYSYLGMQKPSLTSTVNNPLLNPIGWIQFFKALQNGDLRIMK